MTGEGKGSASLSIPLVSSLASNPSTLQPRVSTGMFIYNDLYIVSDMLSVLNEYIQELEIKIRDCSWQTFVQERVGSWYNSTQRLLKIK